MRVSKEKFIILGIFVALVLGSLTGYYFPGAAVKFEFLGSLFFNALYMIIVPLIVASMIVGITALGDVRKLGKTARYTIGYFMATSAVAVVLGMFLVVIFRPGVAGDEEAGAGSTAVTEVTVGSIGPQRGVVDSLVSLTLRAPDPSTAQMVSGQNIPAGARVVDNGDGTASFSWRPAPEQEGSHRVVFFVNDRFKGQIRDEVAFEITSGGSLGFGGMLARIGEAMIQTLNSMIPRNIVAAAAETKVLALIVFSLLFGGVLSSMGATAKPVVTFFQSLNEAIMKLVHLVMFLAPLGVFGIVASRVGDKAGGFEEAAVGIGLFSVVVIIGLLIHASLLLGALRYLGERSPIAYLRNMSEALGTALGVSSSSATLPVTMECVVEKNRVDQRAASFVLPLGTTINMDGTAMYQAVSAIFVCQMFNVPLGIEHYFIILVTAVLASVGTPGLPQAGIVMMSIVMGSVGVPPDIIAQGVAIILVVDWALDRGRTALNVFGDSVGAAIIANTFEFKTAVARPRHEGRGPSPVRERTSRSPRGQDQGKSRFPRQAASRREDRRPNRATITPRERPPQRATPARGTPLDRKAEKRALDSMVAPTKVSLDSLLTENRRTGMPEAEEEVTQSAPQVPDEEVKRPAPEAVIVESALDSGEEETQVTVAGESADDSEATELDVIEAEVTEVEITDDEEQDQQSAFGRGRRRG